MAEKMIQIPERTFFALCDFFGLLPADPDVDDEDLARSIIADLRIKLDAVTRRAAYTQYRLSEDPADREAARQAYLDASGVPTRYRWSEQYDKERGSNEL